MIFPQVKKLAFITNPRINAMILDEPRYFPVIFAAVASVGFVVTTWLLWKRLGGS